MAGLEIEALSRHFRDGTRALDGVDLEIQPGELLVLVGPSGSGKTTLLRLAAGLEEPTAGAIRLGGKDLRGIPPHQRNVALVFQNLALYSHLTVADNLRFGTTNHSGGSKNAVNERVQSTARLLGIEHLLDRLPGELSGGEQQRVALGRAIVRQPAALLLDEPLSSLDGPLRRTLRRELKAVQRSLGVPAIYVTHDQAEALALGDRIAVLDRGKLRQVGTPDEVYHQPADRFVAEFFGPQGMNVITGKVHRLEEAGPVFQAEEWKIAIGSSALPSDSDRNLLCGFRPEDLVAGEGDLPGTVIATEVLGDAIYVQVQIFTQKDRVQTVTGRRSGDLARPLVGEPIRLSLNTDRLHWFDPETGKRIELTRLEKQRPLAAT